MHKLNRRTFLGTAAAASLTWRSMAQALKPRVGCQANGFVTRTGDFEALLPVLRTIASLGYAGFECNNHLVQSQFANPAEAHKKIQATGLEFIGMHMSMNEADSSLDAICAGGAALGCRNIVMSAAGLSPAGVFTPDALAEKAAHLERYGKICKAHGITLAYHNHMPEFANHNAEMQGLADRTNPELVSFLMDAGHAYQGGGDPAEFLRRNPRRLVGCHLKTFRNKTEQVPLGQGDFGFEYLAAAIRSTGWHGWLIDEEGGGKTADSAAVGPDRAYIHRIFGV
ncbi:MAG TPA: sugar phosphate isomerase/epimerase family protein [Acidobacteriaceae bacterium]|nr:sugar phosphate isomerase/epimerase family protein [Acidobacteriaceae bacterium]